MLGGVDEEHIIGLFALFQHQDAHRDAGGKEQVGGQANDGVDMAVLEQFGADAALHAATEQQDRKSTRLNSSHVAISYAVFCLKKKNINNHKINRENIHRE